MNESVDAKIDPPPSIYNFVVAILSDYITDLLISVSLSLGTA